MTAALLDRATTRPPAARQTSRRARPKLRVLDQAASRRRARRRTALLILFVAVLAGFFAVAFVHAELVAGQHELDAVRAEISRAEARHAELARAVEEASAPDVIVTRATELGMVRVSQPLYLAASAPLRDVTVGPPLATPLEATGTTDGSETNVAIAPPAGADGDGSSSTDGLRGSLGVAGGISAAVRVPSEPPVALGVEASPVGATGSSGPATGSPVDPSPGPTVAVADDAGAAPAPTAPVGGIAGTRAVSAAVPASDPASSSAAGGTTNGAASAGVATSRAATAGAANDLGATSSATNSAGGLASVAATTSG